jgi:hypothetical protein
MLSSNTLSCTEREVNVSSTFVANKVEIKQKTLEALRLLRQDDHALNKVREYFEDLTKDI